MKVKQKALESGELKGAELITMPVSSSTEEDWHKRGKAIMSFPVIRGNGIALDKFVPFNWQILAELRQLAAKLKTTHGIQIK